MTTAFTELRNAQISVQKSCALTGISRATYYRRANPKAAVHGPWLPRTPPPAALTDAERAQVTDLLTSPAYQDLAIPQVWGPRAGRGPILVLGVHDVLRLPAPPARCPNAAAWPPIRPGCAQSWSRTDLARCGRGISPR